MSMDSCGPALVAIYVDGQLRTVLLHPHDGGEAYMGPVLRRGVAYARTHYESGNIRDVLMAEPEMQIVQPANWASVEARHVYFIEVSRDHDSARKRYAVRSVHFENTGNHSVPSFASGVPKDAKKIA